MINEDASALYFYSANIISGVGGYTYTPGRYLVAVDVGPSMVYLGKHHMHTSSYVCVICVVLVSITYMLVR